jgi:hypothetical protein
MPRPPWPGNALPLVLLGLTASALVLGLCYRLGWTPKLFGPSHPDPEFRPYLVSADFYPDQVRPGGEFGYRLRFGNGGTRAAAGDYRVFLHFEPDRPGVDCRALLFQDDHQPLEPTSHWTPGSVVDDGPHSRRVPYVLPEGGYVVHAGIYAPDLGGFRLLDQYVARMEVTRSAAESVEWDPEALEPAEIARRRERLSNRCSEPVVLDLPQASFEVDAHQGSWLLRDRAAGGLFGSRLNSDEGLVVWLTRDHQRVRLRNGPAAVLSSSADQLALRLEASDLASGASATVTWQATAIRQEEPDSAVPGPTGGVRLAYAVQPGRGWRVDEVHLLDQALATFDSGGGYTVVPRIMGQLLPTDLGRPASREHRTQDDLTMAMCGVVQGGSALLCTWDDRDSRLVTHLTIEEHERIPGRRVRSLSWISPRPVGALELYPLGAGDYGSIASAYRELAQRRGRLTPWGELERKFPVAARLPGSVYFKPCLYENQAPGTKLNPGPERRNWVNETFEELVQRCEFLRHELELDRALVVLAGWNHSGFDNQLPTVLPAAEVLGGDRGLVDASRRIRELGFVFGLHDNYQDMYRDSPDWNPAVLNRGRNGEAKKSGDWAGGAASLICSHHQGTYARRNLAAVAALAEPDLAFVDAGLAWPLVTCEDPEHPLTREQDLANKLALLDEAAAAVGAAGCEGGSESVLPHALYFEGFCSPPSTDLLWTKSIPLFAMVYGDGTRIYPSQHYQDRVDVDGAERFLSLLLLGACPFYAPDVHLEMAAGPSQVLPLELGLVWDPLSQRLEFAHRWEALAALPEGAEAFVHLSPVGDVESGSPLGVDQYPLREFLGEGAAAWPMRVETAPRPLHFAAPLEDGEYDLWGGVLVAGVRWELLGRRANHGRHYLGRVRVHGPEIRFKAEEPRSNERALARADQGWAEGFNAPARLVKNTFEVATWVDRLAHDQRVREHIFLGPETERSRKGEVEILVHRGDDTFETDEVRLGRFGFLVQSPTFVAFHALRYGGVDYPAGALFTLRSLDGRPLSQSRSVRVYHGFGSPELALWGERHHVPREAVLTR